MEYPRNNLKALLESFRVITPFLIVSLAVHGVGILGASLTFAPKAQLSRLNGGTPAKTIGVTLEANATAPAAQSTQPQVRRTLNKASQKAARPSGSPSSPSGASKKVIQQADVLGSGLEIRTGPVFDFIRTRIQQHLHYPISLRRKGISGRVSVSFKISLKGELESSAVLKSSGFSELDELALQAIRDAAPFQEVVKQGEANPELKQSRRLLFQLPIDFL